ncbi:MAG: hypothetical protein ABR530_09310 [Pyrinomonadaceae bacterium]
MAFVFAITCSAQSRPEPSPSPKAAGEDAPGAQPAKPATASPVHPEFKRWVDIEAVSLSTRYRLVKNSAGVTTNNQQQWQIAARGRFKFDKRGRYSVYAGLFTGNAINSGWNNTGLGTGDLQTKLYVKQLFLQAKPGGGVDMQFGSIAVNNGENTEITGYDNDVYITGERVTLRRPKDVYFDEVSATFAFLGDNNRPSVFRRFRHLNKSNYHQFLVRKQVTKRVGFSADYTFESGRDTLRQAVRVKVPETELVDVVLFENYQRVSPDVGYGFNLSGEKAATKKLTINGGFARIDRPMLNADRFPPGKRLYLGGSFKLSREFSVSSIIIQGVGRLPTLQTPRTRFELILTYNFVQTLRRLKLL